MSTGPACARTLALLDSNPRVTVGLSHGDPGLGNAVLTGRGGIALVDWKDAGRRPISHDVFEVLASSTLSPQQWSDLHPELPRCRPHQSAPAPEQLALVILQFLQGWRHRTARAAHRRALPAHRRRMHRMVQALDVLLA
ncbi:hypothetical protein BJF80_00105 [Serinicoccus sp. CUA-874]|uniref:phosphotransferase n=1 Tax=Serinicoccus sp. CUA-874 TaxID=1517939 RepID=UPI000969DA3D|nr:phosphotransferase [Serinicoccus sp. CUA-874]OLT17780.1 hypothetical protein BJF80_00105 [Serinicoccus sp. CUA-874]